MAAGKTGGKIHLQMRINEGTKEQVKTNRNLFSVYK